MPPPARSRCTSRTSPWKGCRSRAGPRGSKAGAPWKAGVRAPGGTRDDSFAVMELIDHAFSTAGDYERFFFLGDKRYHHIIDTKTGQPAARSRSVTIYAKNTFSPYAPGAA